MAILSNKSWYTQQSNDSSEGYAQAASDASYQYFNDMSWSMWVAASPGNSKHVWSLWEQVSGNNRSWLFSTQPNGTFRSLFSWNGTNFSLHTTASVVCDYSWHHIVFNFASGTIGCYVDGAAQSLTQTIAWGGGSAGLHNPAISHIIGGHSPSNPPADISPSACYQNFTLWSKVLTAPEVAELYNNGTPIDPTGHSAAANLTNWIRMDQTDSGTTIVDQMDSGANLAITTSGTSGVFKQGNNFPVNWMDLIGAAIDDEIGDELTAIQERTDNLPDDPADQSAVEDAINAAVAAGGTPSSIAEAVWDAQLTSHDVDGSFGKHVKKLLNVSRLIAVYLGLK